MIPSDPTWDTCGPRVPTKKGLGLGTAVLCDFSMGVSSLKQLGKWTGNVWTDGENHRRKQMGSECLGRMEAGAAAN